MDLITRDPFFGSLFDELLDNKKSEIMKSDIYEKDGNYVIEIDVPGFKKDEVKVDYENGYLTISAEKSEEHDEEKKNYIRKERFCSQLSRSYYVGDLEESEIKAKFEDGTLKINFPKEEIKSKTKLIPIE